MTDNFIRDYIRSHIQLVSILPDAFDPELAPRGRWFGDDWQGATDWAASENSAGRNVYWTLNLCRPGLNKKPKKTDIIGIRGFGIDVDPPKDQPTWNKQHVLSDILLRGQPSYVIDSARGLQAIWLTQEPNLTQETVETVNRGLSAAFNGDATHNIERLFRLPGLINHGDAKKRAAGYVPAPASLAIPFSGSVATSGVLLQRFPAPAAPVSVVEVLPDGPDPRWTLGDKPTDEIVRMMLNERPSSVAAMFGDAATVRDLWEGNEEKLALSYPSGSGTGYDASKADMALLSKLAFWFGRDQNRIAEAFAMSALGKRDKWRDRQDYRAMSVGRAVGNCENVYSVPARSVAPTPEPEDPEIQQLITAGEVLTIYEQKTYFEGCVYISSLHQVMTPTGEFLKPEAFNATFGGHVFEVGTESFEKKAFTSFTENRLHRFPKVATTMFEPELPFGYISHNRNAVNIYSPDPNVKATPGDVTPILQHFEKMFPNERDREILWTYLAAMVQNPGVKFQWAPFIQGTPGNGKSMIGAIMKRAIGSKYTHEPFSDDLANKFNDWLDSKLLIIIEELSLGERQEVENNIKTWVTADEVEMQAKGGKKAMRPNKSNWLILSNYQNALPIDANQRRYAPFFTHQQSVEDVRRDFPEGYFPALWNWLRDGGYEYITHYLQTRPLHPEFNPVNATRDRAPETSSTAKAVQASRGRFEQEILEAIEAGAAGFRNGWISSNAVTRLTNELRLRISPVKLRAALESLGFVQWGRSTQVIMEEGGTKPVLYIQKGKTGTIQDFISAQGYL